MNTRPLLCISVPSKAHSLQIFLVGHNTLLAHSLTKPYYKYQETLHFYQSSLHTSRDITFSSDHFLSFFLPFLSFLPNSGSHFISSSTFILAANIITFFTIFSLEYIIFLTFYLQVHIKWLSHFFFQSLLHYFIPLFFFSFTFSFSFFCRCH